MKKYCLLLLILFSQSVRTTATAQSRTKAEKEFLQELNEILKRSPNQHWEFDGKMLIDTPFIITSNGMLTSTVRYVTDSSSIRVRSVAPVNKITFVRQDVYVYLEYRDKSVMIYQQNNGKEWQLRFKRNMLHTGIGDEEGKQGDKLQKRFDKLREFYPTDYQ